MEKEFDFDELNEQVKDKSSEELRAEINEMLECLTGRDSLLYHRLFMEAWIAHHLPVTYKIYLEEKERSNYKRKVKRKINAVIQKTNDVWILEQILRCAENVTKED